MELMDEFKACVAKAINNCYGVFSFETIDTYYDEGGVPILDVYNLTPQKCIFAFHPGDAYLVEKGQVTRVEQPDPFYRDDH